MSKLSKTDFILQLQLIRQQAERINEMTSIMYKAVNTDENGDTRKEEELYQRLITENKVCIFLNIKCKANECKMVLKAMLHLKYSSS